MKTVIESIVIAATLMTSFAANAADLNPNQEIGCVAFDQNGHASAINLTQDKASINDKTYRATTMKNRDESYSFPLYISQRSAFAAAIVHVANEASGIEQRSVAGDTKTFEVHKGVLEQPNLLGKSTESSATCYQEVPQN